MINPRKYGNPPYRVAVLHGGPGAPGYMAPVARELAHDFGVIEPLQTKDSINGQVEELRELLTAHADFPTTLIGSSWGAVPALLTAARYPPIVEKLILIGSAVFDRQSSVGIEAKRMERLSEIDRRRVEQLQQEIKIADDSTRGKLFAEWGGIFSGTDTYDALPDDSDVDDSLPVQPEIFQKVWPEFEALRDKPGALKKEFSMINVPAVIIHGEYDPHPIDGIRPFLQACIADVRFHVLAECGHYPWRERRAKDAFYDILRKELACYKR